MSSFITPEQLALLSATVVRCDRVCKFDFASGIQYAWNGNTDLVVGGNTYKPMFGFGRIDGDGYAGGTVSEAVTLLLDGLPEQRLDFLSAALADTTEVDQRMLMLSLQLFNDDWQPVGLPISYFRGYMQPPTVTRSAMQDIVGGTQTITMRAENIFFGRARPPNGRNTDRDQQARSPGDKFFGFVSSLISKNVRYPDF